MRKLQAALATLAELEAKIGFDALDALRDGGDLAGLQKQLTAARERVAMIQAALKAAQERDQQLLQQQRAAMQKTQLNSVKKHLEMRDAAAADFVKHITDAAAAYHKLQDHSAKAKGACPVGTTWPIHDRGVDQVKRHVQHEIFRAGGDQPLPLPVAPDLNGVAVPAGIPPMTEALTRESEAIIAKLTGKLP